MFPIQHRKTAEIINMIFLVNLCKDDLYKVHNRNSKFKSCLFSIIQKWIRNRWNISQYSISQEPLNISCQAWFMNGSKEIWELLHTSLSPSTLTSQNPSHWKETGGGLWKLLLTFKCWLTWISVHHAEHPRARNILIYNTYSHSSPILCRHAPAPQQICHHTTWCLGTAWEEDGDTTRLLHATMEIQSCVSSPPKPELQTSGYCPTREHISTKHSFLSDCNCLAQQYICAEAANIVTGTSPTFSQSKLEWLLLEKYNPNVIHSVYKHACISLSYTLLQPCLKSHLGHCRKTEKPLSKILNLNK